MESEQLDEVKKTYQIFSMLLLLAASCFALPSQNQPTLANPSTSQSAIIFQSSPSESGAALLSVIGAGVALGGLISARWGKRGDK
jgi:hypothetical protein